ncbi:MAG: M48 family metallopeptidase [Deltaproteobacteria bacterium]|jgi:predicted Zn-dependent protease|nr:M48 family metallopeptidase [Deltaproteobacteria bacterium]
MSGLKKLQTCLLSLLLVVFFIACSPVVGTGRSQLNLVDDAELNQSAALQYTELIKDSHLSSNREQTRMIRRVGDRISRAARELMASEGRAAEVEAYKWEFNLIESDEVNAFCMPGGKVAFYTGILPVCQTEAGVAAVMGHEVAHALARHGNERVSQQMMTSIGASLLSIGLGVGGVSGGTSDLVMTAFSVGSTYGVLLPFSRSHEAEADRIGMSLMSMAGYEPQEAVNLWERMAENSGGKSPPFFMSTHPSDQQRIKNLQSYLPEAQQRFKPAGK